MAPKQQLRNWFWYGLVVATVLAAEAGVSRATAGVLVIINKSSQRMDVVVDGVREFRWPVSTGRGGFGTPAGVFRPTMLARRWK